MLLRIIHFLVLIFLITTYSFGQKIIFKGNITDSINTPLHSANIVMFSKDKSIPPSFGITDSNGYFSLEVHSNNIYELTITFIGYKTITENIEFKEKDVEKDFLMRESPNFLEEVVLNYKPPVETKKDTTIYSVEAFSDGKERKLREILKKLPGIEVDRNGDVYIKNQKVTKVLVEDRIFFNGKTQMAVENIPVNVIDEIQMIEDYQETAFLKHLKDSDEIVMNIKLKEGKKNFFFGDIESGLGIKDRYRLHPTLFKYNPQLTLNVIGDINNIATKSFTLGDYLQFEGESDFNGIKRIFNSSISRFLQNDDYFNNKHLFAGFNIQYNPDKIHELRIFTLTLDDKSDSRDSNQIIYQASQSEELRKIDNRKDNAIFLGKIKYRFTPDDFTDLKIETNIQGINLKEAQQNQSISFDENQTYERNNNSKNIMLSSSIDGNKWFSETHTSTVKLNYRYSDKTYNQIWSSLDNLFSTQIPVQEDTIFDINGFETALVNDFAFQFKHYYRPFRLGLLTFEHSIDLESIKIHSGNFQTLSDSDINVFENFQNNLSNTFNDIKTSMFYKSYFGKIITTFGITYQNIFWIDEQDQERIITKRINFLPSLKLEWEIEKNKNLRFFFNQQRGSPEPSLRLANQKVIDFNSIFIGNPFLYQDLNSKFLLSYSSFNTYGWSIYCTLSHRKFKNQIINSNEFEGINGVTQPTQLDADNIGYDILLRLKYNRKYWQFSLTNNYYYNEVSTLFNGVETRNFGKRLYHNLDFRTKLENSPNVDLEIKNSLVLSENSSFENKTTITEFNFELDYNYRNWKLAASYNQTLYRNQSQSNSSNYDQINGSVFYHKENSLWEFGIVFYNLGNNQTRIFNEYNPTRFQEGETVVFPRTIMFNIYYKL